jgi:hypothetical protein
MDVFFEMILPQRTQGAQRGSWGMQEMAPRHYLIPAFFALSEVESVMDEFFEMIFTAKNARSAKRGSWGMQEMATRHYLIPAFFALSEVESVMDEFLEVNLPQRTQGAQRGDHGDAGDGAPALPDPCVLCAL